MRLITLNRNNLSTSRSYVFLRNSCTLHLLDSREVVLKPETDHAVANRSRRSQSLKMLNFDNFSENMSYCSDSDSSDANSTFSDDDYGIESRLSQSCVQCAFR